MNQRDPAILPPRSHGFSRVFMWYSRRLLAKDFNAVRALKSQTLDMLSRADTDGEYAQATPILIYMNHPAWWEPILCGALAGLYFPGAEHYAPIDADALKQYPFFGKLGLFGVELADGHATRAGARRFVQVGRAALAQPNHLLWVTAQGAFRDARRRPVTLMPGIAHLLKRLGAPVAATTPGASTPGAVTPGVRVIPLAVEYTHWFERRPECLLHFGPIRSATDLLAEAHDHNLSPHALLERDLTQAMDRLAKASIARDHAAFRTLIQGRGGVGGLYDLWRSAIAALTGRRIHTRHADLVHNEHPARQPHPSPDEPTGQHAAPTATPGMQRYA